MENIPNYNFARKSDEIFELKYEDFKTLQDYHDNIILKMVDMGKNKRVSDLLLNESKDINSFLKKHNKLNKIDYNKTIGEINFNS